MQTGKTIEDEVGLSNGFCKRLMLTECNVPVLLQYLKCLENEINLSKSYKKITLSVLVYCSRYHSNKKFKDMTKEDFISFLNSLRKAETDDPLHSWISTYNLYLVVLQRFFKWLFYPDLSPKERLKPACVDLPTLKRKEQSIYKPSDMWTQEDDLLFLKYCQNKRDKCYFMIARDSSCRPHELLKIRIKDLVFKMVGGRQYAEVLVNGKTGQRHIPLINSIPYLKDWLDAHPQSGNENAALICGLGKSLGRPIRIESLNHTYLDYKKEIFPKLLNNPIVSAEDKTKIRELLKKPWNPYIRRHSALTEKSKILKENVLRQHAGWSPTSRMQQKYVHYWGNESNEAILEAYGLIDKTKKEIDKLKPRQCPNCNEQNRIDSKFCVKCRMVLTYDEYAETLQRQKHKEDKIERLEKQVNENTQTVNDFIKLVKLRWNNDNTSGMPEEYYERQDEIKEIDKRLSSKGLKEHKILSGGYFED
jgi:integrase